MGKLTGDNGKQKKGSTKAASKATPSSTKKDMKQTNHASEIVELLPMFK
jgi:hypothetical protein